MIELAEPTSPAAEMLPATRDEVGTALAEVAKANTTMTELAALGRKLAAKHKDVVADVRTVKGYEQIAAIRTELRKSVRFPMQDLQKTGSKMLGTMQRQFNERAKELIAAAEALETPFQQQLDVEDQRKAAERLQRELAEAARRQKHLDAIAIITGVVAQAAGKDSEAIQLLVDYATELTIGEDWEEFQGQAQQAKDEAVRQLNGMLVAAKLDEAEAAELEETRRQQALVAAQQATRQREMEAEAAELRKAQADLMEAQNRLNEQRAEQARAQQERAERIQQKIDGFGAAVRLVDDKPHHSEAIQVLIDAFTALTIDSDYADGRQQEAEAARQHALGELAIRHGKARLREAEEARQARAAEVESRIGDIAAMGPRVDETGAELRARLARINAFKLVAADYDDRADEAATLLVEAAADVAATLVEVAAREQEEIQAAEQRRQQEAANAAEQAKAQRLQDAAPRLLGILKRLVADLDAHHNELGWGDDGLAAKADAAALIAEIEGGAA